MIQKNVLKNNFSFSVQTFLFSNTFWRTFLLFHCKNLVHGLSHVHVAEIYTKNSPNNDREWIEIIENKIPNKIHLLTYTLWYPVHRQRRQQLDERSYPPPPPPPPPKKKFNTTIVCLKNYYINKITLPLYLLICFFPIPSDEQFYIFLWTNLVDGILAIGTTKYSTENCGNNHRELIEWSRNNKYKQNFLPSNISHSWSYAQTTTWLIFISPKKFQVPIVSAQTP